MNEDRGTWLGFVMLLCAFVQGVLVGVVFS